MLEAFGDAVEAAKVMPASPTVSGRIRSKTDWHRWKSSACVGKRR